MKKLLSFLAFSFFFSGSIIAQEIPPAPADKAVVYFARVSSLGAAINFSYFDSATLIGRFNGPKYIRYECAPGQHLFWARSENRDFVEADLEAGKIYFIEAVPLMGAIKAGVKLEPLDPHKEGDLKRIDKIRKLMKKKEGLQFTPEQLASILQDLEDAMEKGLEKYKEEKAANSNKIGRLEKTMYYSPQPDLQ